MSKFIRKVDGNHYQIVRALESFEGVQVIDTASVGDGFPDLVVCFFGLTIFIEVKMPGKDLTDKQKIFRDQCKGSFYLVHFPHEAVEAVQTHCRKFINRNFVLTEKSNV